MGMPNVRLPVVRRSRTSTQMIAPRSRLMQGLRAEYWAVASVASPPQTLGAKDFSADFPDPALMANFAFHRFLFSFLRGFFFTPVSISASPTVDATPWR
jgi:hypothetical protein